MFSDTGPEAEAYGASKGYPVPPFEYPPGSGQDFMVGTYSHFDKVHPMRTVSKPATPSILKRAAKEIVPVYHYDGRQKAIGDYLDTHPVTGLLIARGDTILFEHYRYARAIRIVCSRIRWRRLLRPCWSALRYRKEQSAPSTIPLQPMCRNWRVQNTAPRRCALCFTCLQASLFRNKPISQTRTFIKLHVALLGNNAVGAIAALRQFNTRDAPPDTRFAYASSETEVLGLVVSRAVHMPLAEYLATRIWQKLGAESDAAWAIDPTGQEVAYCCFIATLRDWARLGLMLANDGAWNGQQIVPRQWLLDATSVPPDSYLRNTIAQSWGYGYQVWILPGERRMFFLLGISGQGLFVDPQSKLIMVQTAVRKLPVGNPKSPEAMALWYAVVAQFGHR